MNMVVIIVNLQWTTPPVFERNIHMGESLQDFEADYP